MGVQDLTVQMVVIVVIGVFFASFMDAIAGGGGIISVPTYLLAGLPMHFALGTNKFSSSIGTAFSTGRYIKNGYVDWKLGIPSIVLALIGSFFGTKLQLMISEVYLQYLLLIVLPLILMFLREPLGKLVARDPDWKPEDSIGDFILQNFFELFETLLSYLSNTMSFLRVGAFVLVHAGMMMAVFALADLFGPFGYTVTVVIGNGLVMVMEATLVAIQVMRLEFYEMFSRYYIGDGQVFTPLSAEADS